LWAAIRAAAVMFTALDIAQNAEARAPSRKPIDISYFI
jgi:hypothetical protein